MKLRILICFMLFGLPGALFSEKTIGTDHAADGTITTPAENRQGLDFLAPLQHEIRHSGGQTDVIENILYRYATEIENIVAKSPDWQRAIPFEIVMNSHSHYLVSAPSPDYLSVLFLVEYPGAGSKSKPVEPFSLPRAFTFRMRTDQRLSITDLFEDWKSVKPPFMKLLSDYAKQQYCPASTITKLLGSFTGKEQNFYLTAGGLHLLSGIQGLDPFTCDSELYVPKEALLKIGIRPDIWHSALSDIKRN